MTRFLMKIISILKQKKSSISQDGKSILTLVGGTALAQVFGFLFSPVTTRIFAPEVFGDLSVFISITGIVGIVICLRYELAIVLPQDDDEAFSLLKLCFVFTSFISVITGLIFFFAGKEIYTRFGAENLVDYWYYVPISLLLAGFIQASNYWLTRTRQFTVLAWNKVLPVLVVNLVSIGLGLMGDVGIKARLFAILASNLANIAVIARVIGLEFKPKKHNAKFKYKELIYKYKNFLVYDVWGALLNNLSWMLVPILMNAYYGSNAAGQYSISLRVIQIPASLIGASISQVFLKTGNDRKFEKTLFDYCRSTAKKLLLFSVPIAITLIFFGKPLFQVVFGNKWNLAGEYSQILAPWALLWFVSSPLSAVFTICQKQRQFLLISIANLVTRFLSLYVGKLYNSDLIGISIFSATGFIVYGINLILSLRIARRSDKGYE